MSRAPRRTFIQRLALSVVAVAGMAGLAACGPVAADPTPQAKADRSAAAAPAAPEGAERGTPPAASSPPATKSAAPRTGNTSRPDSRPAKLLRTRLSVMLSGDRYAVERDGRWTRVVDGRTTAGRLTGSRMAELDRLLDSHALARESRLPAPTTGAVRCCDSVLIYDMGITFRSAATGPRPTFDGIVKILTSLR